MNPGRGAGRRRQWRASLALAGGSILATLLALEIAVRLAGVPVGTVQISRATLRRSADPALLFELVPGASVRAEVDYRVNSDGMRNPEVAAARPAGVRRLAVLGDSIAFGYWVAEPDAFPRQLEALLNRRRGGQSVEVLNFAVPGYNLDQELEVLRTRVGRLRPDVVIFAFCLNDLEGLFSYELGLIEDRSERRATWTGRLDDALLARSRLLSFVEYRWTEWRARRLFVKDKNPWRASFDPAAFEGQRAALAVRFARAADQLSRLGGVPGVVAVFPTFGHRFERYPFAPLHALVTGTAEAARLRGIDLLDCFRPYDFRAVRVDVVHPNPLGHRVAAHALAAGLSALGLAGPGDWPPPGLPACTGYRAADFPRVRGY